LVTVQGEGTEVLPPGAENLVYSSAARMAESLGKNLPPDLRIRSNNNIPIASGLGSSAAAIISGLLGADRIFEAHLNASEMLGLAKTIEGHPDNIAACLLGGLVLVQEIENKIKFRKLEMKSITTVVVVPDFNLSTKESREALPDSYGAEDVVKNIGNCVQLIESLRTGDYQSLRNAMQDRIHQPYRLPLLPGAESAINVAYNSGAVGACLSGAGPSVIAFVDAGNSESIKNAMVEAYHQEGLTARAYIEKCPSKGAFIT
jgi:homoserine kinase